MSNKQEMNLKIIIPVISPAKTKTHNSELIFEPISPVFKDQDIFVDITTDLTFQLLVETLLKNNEYLDKFNIKLNPEIQNYLLQFCQENPNFFTNVEDSFKLIILDNTINSKDIPELLTLIIRIYEIIKVKQPIPHVDPYTIIELLLQILLISFISNNGCDVKTINKSTAQIVDIIKISIELLKLPIIKISKNRYKCLCF